MLIRHQNQLYRQFNHTIIWGEMIAVTYLPKRMHEKETRQLQPNLVQVGNINHYSTGKDFAKPFHVDYKTHASNFLGLISVYHPKFEANSIFFLQVEHS